MVNQIKKNRVPILCMLILGVYCTWMLIINFSGNPIFYDADMYSDMLYSVKAWEHKSIFPEGWVFGNQLYAVATPVLAALFYGLTGSMCNAMAIASTVMGAGVMLSFCWMLKPVLQKRDERSIALTFFLTLVLAVGDIYHEDNGWQLLFTMCSYYACYAISAFLAFGCWLRSDLPRSPGSTAMLPLACLMAFGTGIQSLRQTAIMICPLIGLELLRLLFLVIRKEKICFRSLLITGLLTAANLAGVLYAKFAAVDHHEIFGTIDLLPPSLWPGELSPAVFTAGSLLVGENFLLTFLLPVFGLPGLYFLLRSMFRKKKQKAALLLSLFFISVAVILVIDTCTTMFFRSIYYFLLYPMTAFLAAYLYSSSKKVLRTAILVLLLVIFGWTCTEAMPVIAEAEKETVFEEVADYLLENNFTTVYSRWGLANKLAVASDGELAAGFWYISEKPFVPVDYLCDPDIFYEAPSVCAYVFFGEEDEAFAIQKFSLLNVGYTLQQHFPASDIYVYTSDKNIMNLFLTDEATAEILSTAQ